MPFPPKLWTMTSRKQLAVVAAAGAILAAGGVVWHQEVAAPPASQRATRPVYTSQGYGGFVPATSPPARAGHHAVPLATPPDPMQPARAAYDAGHYLDAERQAQQVIRQNAGSQDAAKRRQAADARQVMAYAAARRKNLALARVRFATLRQEAAQLPAGGREQAPPGVAPTSLEEEAAFQHAVCTNALGHPQAAEAEYCAFMKRYPESPLMQAAIQRITRFHGGNLPKSEEALWQQAQWIAIQRQKVRAAAASVCGPECLSEMLRREGRKVGVAALAKEMGTSDRGTSLATLAAAAQAHGFHPQGVALTQKGLAAQTLPVIALVAPGHYVLVEAVAPQQVTVWDPDARGVGQSGRRLLPLSQWQQLWQGVTLTLATAAMIPSASTQRS